MTDPRVLAVIPARAGSKGVPMKNMRPLLGKPLVQHTIDLCFELDYDTVITTDIRELYKLDNHREGGSLMVRERPKELCNDTALAWDVWRDAALPGYDIHLYLEPTSPCRTAQDVKDCVATLVETEGWSLFTVSESPVHPQKIFELPSRVIRSANFYNNTPRQDYPGHYFVKNGICYACTDERMQKGKTMLDIDSYAYTIHRPVVNIDREVDFLFAEALLRENTT